MDNQRFDALVSRLSASSSRREGLRILFAGLAAGLGGLAATGDAAAHCKGDGSLCRHGSECCSRACRNRKRLKKKNGERTKQKIGQCGCSTFRQQCHASSDCCDFLLACGDTGCEDHPVCCKAADAACEDDCDCCGDNVCGDSDTCEPQFCSETQDFCDDFTDCCDGNEFCDVNVDSCDRPPGQKVCCRRFGRRCEESCDCCSPFVCDDVAAHCGADGPICCRDAGDDCDEDCECCLGLECDEDLEQCVAPASTCPPGKVGCTSPNRIKDCCDEGFAECCDQGATAGCCQTGFPVCCAKPHEETGAGCCPAGFRCCAPTDVVPCCPENQVCCPGGETFCADTLEDCDPV